ncbi:MAG: YqjK family protein [Burkholderiales bacterium]
MNERQIELYVQRGRLRERISVQRGQLARELAPVSSALQGIDRTRTQLRLAQAWLVHHPTTVTAAVVGLLVWRPRSVFSAARWGYSAWRSWARLKQWFGLVG